jgi:hypothetical protein
MHVMQDYPMERHPAGSSFLLKPDVYYEIGSVRGAKTWHCNTPPATGATRVLQEDDVLDGES